MTQRGETQTVNEERYYHLFLAESERRHEIDCLDVSKLNVMPKQENKEELADVFLLVISVELLLFAFFNK